MNIHNYGHIEASDPTVSVNDESLYERWLNLTTGEVFVCIDNTVDDNHWVGNQGTEVLSRYYFADDLSNAPLGAQTEYWTPQKGSYTGALPSGFIIELDGTEKRINPSANTQDFYMSGANMLRNRSFKFDHFQTSSTNSNMFINVRGIVHIACNCPAGNMVIYNWAWGLVATGSGGMANGRNTIEIKDDGAVINAYVNGALQVSYATSDDSAAEDHDVLQSINQDTYRWGMEMYNTEDYPY